MYNFSFRASAVLFVEFFQCHCHCLLATQMKVEFIPKYMSDGGSKVLIVGLRGVIKKKFLWIKK
jgi:hypothetical protein